MRTFKKWLALLLAGSLYTTNFVTTFATNNTSIETPSTTTPESSNGWFFDGVNYSYYVNSEKLTNCTYFIDGKWWLFDSKGNLAYNQKIFAKKGNSEQSYWFRSTSDGSLILGWYFNGTYWFYHDTEDGHLYYNQVFEVDGNSYYVNYDSILLTSGWYMTDDGKTYWADASGVLTEKTPNGWIYDKKGDGYWHYYQNGVHLTNGIYEIDGAYYHFNSSGIMSRSTFYYYDKENEKYGHKLADLNGHVFMHNKGWQLRGTNYYYFEEPGWLAVDKFLTINGDYYRFDSSGIMEQGSFRYYDKDNDKLGYKLADLNGHVFMYEQGWKLIENNYYYFEEPGWLATGKFLTIDGKEYFFNENHYTMPPGAMVSGIFSMKGKSYVTDNSGAIYPESKTGGWAQYNSEWYYFKSPYVLAKNEFLDINGKTYYFYTHGKMAQGFVWVNGNCYLTDNTGAIIKNQWFNQNGNWYYMNPSGTMATGWVLIGNDWYYMKPNGSMATGWILVGNDWYYMKPNGSMATGWILVGNDWYYMNPNGSMATGWILVDNNWYYMNPNGSMATGWVLVSNNWYYMNPNGSMATGWVLIGNDWYYMNPNGSMASNQWIGSYYVDVSGKIA